MYVCIRSMWLSIFPNLPVCLSIYSLFISLSIMFMKMITPRWRLLTRCTYKTLGSCWPQIQRGMAVCTRDYPPSPTLYRYLNSGAWMGYAKDAAELLYEVMSSTGRDPDNEILNQMNDQVGRPRSIHSIGVED